MTSKPDADGAALEPFFAAAKAAGVMPRTALLSAILADAADVSAARRAAAAPPAPRRPGWRRPVRLLQPIGGWRGLAILGACAAVGFWLGLAGNVTIDGTTIWAGSTTLETSADPVGDFFDMASAGG